MNEFEQLKNDWGEQSIEGPSPADFSVLKSKIVSVTRKQKVANVILLATVGVLTVFFYYIKAIEVRHVAIAIGAMIAALVIRVLVEFFSIAHLKNLTTTANIQHFREKLQNYYGKRLWVHLALTPILLSIYSYAFWTLLPDFKASLSKGFYDYIVYSSLVILFIFILFIGNEVRKELKVLRALKSD